VVSLGVLIDRDNECVQEAGGYLIQLMPNTEPYIVDFIEEMIKKVPSVTTMLRDGMLPEDILKKLLGELGLTIHQSSETAYKCNCSRERMLKNIITLGKKEIKDIIDETGEAELQCHFCNNFYKFDKKELYEIYNCE
jgi:molecular chaperone Hsp33